MRVFDLSRNQNVEFLPIRLSLKFPDLVEYNAEGCRLGEISKSHFENLFNLRSLNLNGNRLKTINIDTFRDLCSLEFLLLGKFLFIWSFWCNSLFLVGNEIKTLQSELFKPLRKIQLVKLKSNVCINENFYDVEALKKIVDENCKELDSAEVEPICEMIGKCHIGEKCCRLSDFKSFSRTKLKSFEQETDDLEVDAIFYNNNMNVEYLLAVIGSKFRSLKVYSRIELCSSWNFSG